MAPVASSTTSPPSSHANATLTLIEQVHQDPTAVPPLPQLPPPKSFQLNGLINNKITIGRSTSCDVMLSSLQISRRHAILEYKQGKWFIQDLSTNGISLQTPNNPAIGLIKTVQTVLPSSVIIHFTPGISYHFTPATNKPQEIQQKQNEQEESLQQENNSPSIRIISNKRKSEMMEALDNKKSKTEDNQDNQDTEDKQLQGKKTEDNEDKIKKLEAEVEALKEERIIQQDEMRKNQEIEVASRVAVIKNEIQRKFVEAMESEFLCSVCSEVFIQPCTTQCGHTVCHLCITKWLQKNPACPICRCPCPPPSKHFEMDNYLAKVYAILGGEEEEKRAKTIKERGVSAHQLATATAQPPTPGEVLVRELLETLRTPTPEQQERVIQILRSHPQLVTAFIRHRQQQQPQQRQPQQQQQRQQQQQPQQQPQQPPQQQQPRQQQ